LQQPLIGPRVFEQDGNARLPFSVNGVRVAACVCEQNLQRLRDLRRGAGGGPAKRQPQMLPRADGGGIIVFPELDLNVGHGERDGICSILSDLRKYESPEEGVGALGEVLFHPMHTELNQGARREEIGTRLANLSRVAYAAGQGLLANHFEPVSRADDLFVGEGSL